MQFHSPLNVDLSTAQRAVIFRNQRVNGAISHAKQSARKYANIVAQRADSLYATKVSDILGTEASIAHTMGIYGVRPALRTYAAKIVLRLISERAVR